MVEQRREGAGGACRGSRPELVGAIASLTFITKETGSHRRFEGRDGALRSL